MRNLDHTEIATRAAGTLAPFASLAPGARIGSYVVTRFLASGGFGAVYAVHDPRADRPAALKVLHPELRSLGDPFVRFLREARVLELLRHPNVVEIYGSGSLPDGRAYVVTELLVGCDLEERIERMGALSLAETIELLGPVCDALGVAHDAKVIHRDIKASNIFLDQRGDAPRVVLLDFGLAKLIEAGGLELTSSRVALGTPASMAPEQLRGGAVDARTDVYGLGVLAYHMLTGRLPFTATSHAAMAHLHLHGKRPRASLGGRISLAVDAVLERAMATRPADRFADARAFHAALAAAAADRDARPTVPHAADAAVAAEDAVAAVAAEEIGIFVSVGPADADASAPDALDAIDAAMERAEELVAGHGFAVAFESASGILLTTDALGDAGARRTRTREAILAAVNVWRALGTRRDLRVGIAIHRGDDVRRADRWLPAGPIGAVVATRAAVDGLDVETAPVPGSDRLVRIVPPPALRDSQRVSHADLLVNLGRRTASIVHDLRSPLGAILINAELLLATTTTGEPVTTDHREMLEDVIAATHILKASIDTMMTAASERWHDATRKRTSVRAVIDRALALTDSQIRARTQVDADADDHVLAAPGQLVQVVTNLVVNAADAAADGDITIRATTTEAGCVELSVHDTGPGIPADLQARIFDPFFTTKEPGRGTGLGLSIVHQIVTEHGGRISVTSSAGAGTRFTIRLPAAA